MDCCKGVPLLTKPLWSLGCFSSKPQIASNTWLRMQNRLCFGYDCRIASNPWLRMQNRLCLGKTAESPVLVRHVRHC